MVYPEVSRHIHRIILIHLKNFKFLISRTVVLTKQDCVYTTHCFYSFYFSTLMHKTLPDDFYV